jgi:hypothetical protein
VEDIMSISKKDGVISWRAGGVIIRDARATKEPETEIRHSAKKNTKKWCGGKVGREHKPRWVSDHNKLYSSASIFECEKCKKHLDYCWPWGKSECKCGLHGK